MVILGFWLVFLVCSFTLQIIHWVFIFSRLAINIQAKSTNFENPVSIIICARNARLQLEHNLFAFLNQDYSAFEVIVVDDDSTDGSFEWLTSLSRNQPKLRIFKNQKTKEGKKQALQLGISKARHSWIALSDADCKPSTSLWLKMMLLNVYQDTKIVLGYAPYHIKTGWLNKLIRFECAINSIQYLSAAQSGIPYMGTGRNLIYHKSIYSAFALQPEIAYGDDDLLIGSKATNENTSICISPMSFIYTEPSSTYQSYFSQKWRHYAASIHYKLKVQIYLMSYYFSFIGFFISCAIILFSPHSIFSFVLITIYFAICWSIFAKLMKRLKEENLTAYFPFLCLLYIGHLMLQIPFLFIQKKSW